MNLQNFKETYKGVILESTDDAKLKNYIRSIVEEMIADYTSIGGEVIEEETSDPEQQKLLDLLQKHLLKKHNPEEMKLRELEAFIRDEGFKHKKLMEPWDEALRKREDKASKRRKVTDADRQAWAKMHNPRAYDIDPRSL